MADNNDTIFGYKGIFRSYGWKDFFLDLWKPALFAVIGIGLCFISDMGSYEVVKKTVGLGISIMPSYLGLLVAAYTLLISFFTSEEAKKIMAMENKEKEISGKELIVNLNGNFAVCVIGGVFCLLTSFIVSYISSLGLTFEYADVINNIVLFVLLFLLSFSMTTLFGVIQDIFNLGQCTIL